MHIALSDEHERLRSELRSYFAELVTPELRRALTAATGEFGDVDAYKGLIRQLGSDRWLGIGWPEEYGGQDRPMIEQLIFSDEAAVAGIPIPHLTLNTVGPTIMRFGSDEQKQELLPKILEGELHFSIGYSEPASGTDLASVRTRARREGDEWVINGQKMWTSLIQYADWIWLACRTDPDLPRHKGLSMILVPTSTEGFSYTPVHTVAGVSTSATGAGSAPIRDSMRSIRSSGTTGSPFQCQYQSSCTIRPLARPCWTMSCRYRMLPRVSAARPSLLLG